MSNLFLADFSLRSRYSDYKKRKEENARQKAVIERRSPGITLRDGFTNGAMLGAIAPLSEGVIRTGFTGKSPKNMGKATLAYALGGGLTGAGLNMLLRSPRDLKGEGAKDSKGRRVLHNVGRGALVGAGLAGVGALRLRGRGYRLSDIAGKTFNNVAAGATLGSGGALLGTKLYNRFKKDDQ